MHKIGVHTAAPPQYLTLVQNWEHVHSSQVEEEGGRAGWAKAAHGDPSAWYEGVAC